MPGEVAAHEMWACTWTIPPHPVTQLMCYPDPAQAAAHGIWCTMAPRRFLGPVRAAAHEMCKLEQNQQLPNNPQPECRVLREKKHEAHTSATITVCTIPYAPA